MASEFVISPVVVADLLTGSKTITILGFPPAVEICQTERYNVVWFAKVGTANQSLRPQELIVHTAKWDQRNNDGQQVSPGRYIVAIPDYTFEGVAIEQVSGGIKFSEALFIQ